MKKYYLPLLLLLLLPFAWSCSSLKNMSLSQQDATAALKQMLALGARESVAGSFSKEAVMTTIFPESIRKALNTAQQLGLTPEVDRFTTTLGTAAEKTAATSLPVFLKAIDDLSFTDAVRLVKGGGTSATDYLRSTSGESLRAAIKPAMQAALDEYKLNEEWNKLAKPVQTVARNRVNLDLPNLMAGMVSEAMFRKMEEKEKQVRTETAARTTPLLQKVFSRQWTD